MFKGRWILLSLLVIGVIVFRNSFSQSFFLNNSGTGTPQESKKGDLQTVKQVSPSEFKSNVSNLFKQNQKKLAAEVNSKVSKSPPIAPLPGPPPADNSNKTKNSTETPEASAPSAPPAAPPSGTLPPPPPSQPKSDDSSSNMPPPQPSQPDSQPYTGFGDSQNKSNQTDSQPSSGNWNIQY